jgi:hypothetical protein
VNNALHFQTCFCPTFCECSSEESLASRTTSEDPFDSWFWIWPARLDKTLFFGPQKVNAKSAADSLLKTQFGGGAFSRQSANSLLKTPCGGGAVSRQGANSDTQEDNATSAESVDLETSNWMHVVCSLDSTNIVDKRAYKRDPKMTRLKSIAGTGIGDINREALGSWCSCNGIITGT